MVPVPGPFLLNGTLDLLGNRLPLGISRLLFVAIELAASAAVPAQVPRSLQAAMTDGGSALRVAAAMTIGIVIPQHARATWCGGAPAGH